MIPAAENPLPDLPRNPDGSFLPPGALVISASRIQDAGLGLFAGEGIRAGTWICEYIGEKKSLMCAMTDAWSHREIMHMKDRQYVMGTGHINCHIDATNHLKVFARYCNDNKDKNAINAEFVKIKQQRRVLLRATKDVMKGSEIYAPYGEVFWRNRQQEIRSSRDTS